MKIFTITIVMIFCFFTQAFSLDIYVMKSETGSIYYTDVPNTPKAVPYRVRLEDIKKNDPRLTNLIEKKSYTLSVGLKK